MQTSRNIGVGKFWRRVHPLTATQLFFSSPASDMEYVVERDLDPYLKNSYPHAREGVLYTLLSGERLLCCTSWRWVDSSGNPAIDGAILESMPPLWFVCASQVDAESYDASTAGRSPASSKYEVPEDGSAPKLLPAPEDSPAEETGPPLSPLL